MDEMQMFEFNGSQIRVKLIDDAPWFVGKDVASALGYAVPLKALKDHVSDREKGVTEMDTPGGVQSVITINESGLYTLILSSKLPEAEQFKYWVTSEVLPSIRRYGFYGTNETIDKMIINPDFGIKLLNEIKAEREKRRALAETVATQKRMLEEASPKVTYYDLVLQSKDCISINKIAKDYGRSAIWLNKYLSEKGIQYKQSGIWILYQKYADKGYTSTKTFASPASDGYVHSHITTYWTQKGRLFIYELLKGDGYLPMVENAGGDTRDGGGVRVSAGIEYTDVEDTGVCQ